MLYVILSFGILSLCAFLYQRTKSAGAVSLILKTTTSLLFIAAAITGVYIKMPGGVALQYSLLFVCGLLLGLIGDIFLDLKIMYPGHADTYTFSGMAAFALGHIFYIYASIMYFGFDLWSLAVSAAVILLILLSIKLFKLKIGKFWPPVIIYTILLSFFASNALFNMVNNWNIANTFVFFGALFFLLSDLILSMTYFGGKNGKGYIIINHILYYMAQYALALSIVLL